MSNDSDHPDVPQEPDPEHPEESHRRSPINPFEAAMRRAQAPDIRVEWSLGDMQLLRPDWTAEQCAAFMRRHAHKFAAGMIRVGLTMLASMSNDARYNTHYGPISSNGDGKTSPPES